MIAAKLQVEADSDSFIESETMSTTTESSFDNLGGRNKDKSQVQKKMKKLISIKLSRIPSTRKGRSKSSQFRTKLSGYAASSEQSTPIEMSDASPNHISATNLENFQVLPTTESGFKLFRSVTRKPSMKLRRPQIKKKSSRREVNSQDMDKEHLQASSCCSGSSFDSSDLEKNISGNEKQQLAPGNKSGRVVRTSTLGPMKILTKMASLKSKRTKKCSEISSIPDPNIERDTCSSTLKSCKFPDHLEIKPGGNESNETATSNVCRYSYCSLHGHRHGDKPPPLKRFVSMRWRAAKSQKSLKPDPKSSGKPKHSGNRKGVQAEKRVLNGDLGVADQQTTVDIREVPFVPGMEGSDFVDLAESVPGESSYPSHEERQSPETFQVFKDIGVDCSGIGEQQKAICDTSIKIEETKRINNGDRKSIQALDRLKGKDVSSKEFGDPAQFDNLSCNASFPLAAESHRDIDGDLASISNLEEYGHSRDDVKTLETISSGDSCELPNSIFLSAPVTGVMEKPTSAIEDKNEGSDIDSRILQPADPMAASNSADVASKKEMENQKSFTFWKLIYRQMATGIDAEPETQTPRPGMNSEEQAEDLLSAHEKNDSCQENSRADQAMSIKDHEASNLKLEFTQSDTIKLVQQAFDKILSEIPDNSSDDQSVVSEETSDQEFLLKKQNEGREVSISTLFNSIEYCMVQDREKNKLQTDKELVSEEVKAAQKEGKRSDTQMPSNWSSLKKIIILRRFVKSLEKVRNLKPKTIRYLPPAKDQEPKNIQLRRQTEKGKKNAEEWMLDLALRQVISTLAPSQKRKVAMLVQAFETVIPAENGEDMRSNVASSSPTTSDAYNEFPFDNGDGTENQIGSEISSGKPLYSEMDSTVGHDQCSKSNIAYRQLKRSSLDSKETSLLRSCKEKPLCTAGSEMNGTDMKNENTGTGVTEEQTSATEDKNEGSDLDSGILQPADPMADTSSMDVESKKEMENQKNFTFWKLIYRQMATGLEAEPETQTPCRCPEMNSEEQAEDMLNAHEKNDSCWEISQPDQATRIEDHEASDRKLEFSQSDAIKLVQQAFDKILSEIPDNSSDDQSIVSEKTSDQEFLLKKQDEGKEVSISTSSNFIEDCTVQDGEEMKVQTDKEIVSEKVKAAQKEGLKSAKQMPSSWSYLKKIIILKRFVKSLEKVRNLKPKTIRYLPPSKDQEAENIQLRPQTEKGKKNAEEWMLDLALRQVISTLAPSQKRKVAMLVQAFETITPADNGDDMSSNVAASSPTTSFQAYNVAGSEISGTDMKKEDMGAPDDNKGNEVSIVDLSLTEPRLSDKCLTGEDAIRTSHDKTFPVNENVIQPISKEETSVHSSEVCNACSEISKKKMDLESNDLSNSPAQQPDTPEFPAEVGEGAQQKYKFLCKSLEQSESSFEADISKSERQKYTRLWYLIYKHMVSDSPKENRSQPLADEEVQSDDASQRPLPEIQYDELDNQSVIGDIIPDQELPEKKPGQEEVKILSSTLDSKEKIPSSENVDTKREAKGGTEEGNISKKRVQRNWSNLKKLVLLRRFVKALDKVKEFNPRGPRYLPVDPAPESEKVLLRQQNTGDKKNAEEWMLDYALQQVVAKLTPERKRRVGLLVEAFETVIPTIS